MDTPPEIGWSDVFRVAKTQVSNRLGDEVAILELEKGIYFGLNPTGARIWQLLHQAVSVQSLHEALVAEYDVNPETARDDLLKVLGEMQAQGLIERVDATG